MHSKIRSKETPKWIQSNSRPARSSFIEPDDESFQSLMLAGVSRTFALTIPQLPGRLRFVVSNAYLLCRILDTIEDEPGLAPAEKRVFFEEFEELVKNERPAEAFAASLAPRLTGSTIEAEHELIRRSPRVLNITRGFNDPERQALSRCVRIMSRGMNEFQNARKDDRWGLQTLEEMDRYCYYVAGVVGEMLTELFCAFSPEMARHRQKMMRLAPSFGQGLQMTNILKDIWEDRERSACWLPREVFDLDDFDPGVLEREDERARLQAGLEKITGLAHGHLRKALAYTLYIPAGETGARKFCLWAIGMALLTLRKIKANPRFTRSEEVKISRRSVKATIAVANLLVRRDDLLRGAFSLIGRTLPVSPVGPVGLRETEPGGPAKEPPARERVESAVARAAKAVRQKQHAGGYWSFELEADCTITAEYILMMHFLGEVDESLQEAMAKYLRRRQGNDGGWPLYFGGEAEISCSVKTYYALKLAGNNPAAPHMLRARTKILALGGASKCNVFTRITLALFGQVPWRAVPFMPVELVLLPRWFPFHLSKVAYWSRTVMVPLLVLCSHRARAKNPAGTEIRELFKGSPEQERDYFPTRSRMNVLFLIVDRAARHLERLIPARLRRRATDRAVEWFSERLNATHGLGAIFPAMVNACEAYATLGYGPDHPRRVQTKTALEKLVARNGDEAYCQPCVSPVWDTGLAAIALREAGGDENLAAAGRGLDWLKDRQLLDFRGDWSESRPNLPGGGWPFQFENAHYPDLDDTALVAFAMSHSGADRYAPAIKRAADWLAGMQSKNGGFASFEVDNTHYYLNEIPFADHGALLDPPTADVSARCAMLFGCLEEQTWAYRKALRRALDYLDREQEEDGAWFGRWGANYVYGTWSVLLAFEQINAKPRASIQRAVAWLKRKQRPDGGWGESNDSYHHPELRGEAERSTAFQTAWALIGLMAAGEGESGAVSRGIGYLLRTRAEDGLWHDPEFTCPGFPRVFYLKYHGYDKYFPLWALARFFREKWGKERDEAL